MMSDYMTHVSYIREIRSDKLTSVLLLLQMSKYKPQKSKTISYVLSIRLPVNCHFKI